MSICRILSTSKQKLKGAALDRFLLRKYGRSWDSVPIPHVAQSQLSKPAIQKFRKLSKASQRIDPTVLKEPLTGLLDKLNLLDGPYLKRAAALLFLPEPDRVITGAYVKIGFFRTNTDLLYQDEVHGDLFSQVEKTVELLQTKYLRAGISYQGLQRMERFPIPEAALREAILNAIIHKDYATGIPIQISVYDSKLMIWNNGALPEHWNLKKLLGKHSSQPYNPEIANTFFRAGHIESWGRGIERIFEACKVHGSPKPKFKAESIGLWTVFGFGEEVVRTTQETREESREKTGVKTREKILTSIMADPSITTASLARLLDITAKGVEWQMKRLKAEGMIERIGPDKGGHWVVKDKMVK
jgi:ATP-dependent DNA helicase RecG